MLITYYVEDGYLSGSRPQRVNINDEDLEECESDAEKIELIESAIRDHFEQNISWSCDIQKYLLQSKA